MVAILLLLGWAGYISYSEEMKTEASKRNGEAWVSWFKKADSERASESYTPSECAKIKSFNSLNSDPNLSVHTWGKCLQALSKQPSSLPILINPFSNSPLEPVAKCNEDYHLAGFIMLEKLTPTPDGSPVPFTASPLIESDQIDQKMKIRVTVCDRGAYPILIDEVDF
jgi:hypothetical protein